MLAVRGFRHHDGAMKLARIEISNFRCFDQFDLQVAGESLIFIAPNGGGKTSLLVGLRYALSGGSPLALSDFADTTRPVEIIATLTDLDPADQAAFADAVSFGGDGATLRVGVKGVWDDSAAELDVTWGYPDHGWTRVARDARERLLLLWLPSWRDPGVLLSFVGRRSLLQLLVDALSLDQPLADAVAAIDAASTQLAGDAAFAQLLSDLRSDLARLIPRVSTDPYSVEVAAADERDLLRQLELGLAYSGPTIGVTHQSSGLAQLTIFALAFRILSAASTTLTLVDEPEISLQPHAQRALTAAIVAAADQAILATHSSNVLDRIDPRRVVRLKRDGGSVIAVRPSGLTDDDAKRLARYATSQTAEALFAMTVILVEGISDYFVVRLLAHQAARSLDGEGVTVLSMEGAGMLRTYVALLGPHGFQLRLAGLCDVDAEASWLATLQDAGVPVHDRASMESNGFFVCDQDLEDELVRAIGDAETQSVIAAEGEAAAFAAFAAQQGNVGLSVTEQLVRFLRRSKPKWSPLLAERAAHLGNVPAVLTRLLSNV